MNCDLFIYLLMNLSDVPPDRSIWHRAVLHYGSDKTIKTQSQQPQLLRTKTSNQKPKTPKRKRPTHTNQNPRQ